MFYDVKTVDIVLFSTVAVLWTVNLAVMVAKKRVQNRLSTGLLYSILGIITITRLTEVIYLQMYMTEKVVVVAGIIATYAKIALGCCQLSAMIKVAGHMKDLITAAKADHQPSVIDTESSVDLALSRKKRQISRKGVQRFLLCSLVLTLILGSFDMTISLKSYGATRNFEVVFSLIDAVVFSLLTIALTVCTVKLFILLKQLRH